MSKKQYPPFFEKAIPFALIFIGVLVVILLGVIVFVFLQY